MEPTNRFFETTKTKYIVYSILFAVAFSWPWVLTAATGSAGEGDLADLICLGILPAIIISIFIVYREMKSSPASYKWAFTVALAAAFLLVWIIPAVGIFRHSGDPADLIYFGVLAVGVIGAIIVRFRPQGMARTLFAMATAQMLVEVIGLLAGLGSRLILNGFFVVLWVTSALLFRKAAQGNQNGAQYNHKIL